MIKTHRGFNPLLIISVSKNVTKRQIMTSYLLKQHTHTPQNTSFKCALLA